MRRLLAISIALVVAACGVPSGAPAGTAKGSPGASSDPDAGLGDFHCSYPWEIAGTTERAQISGVQIQPRPNYDRIVFEFQGLGAEAIPTIEFKVASPPFSRDPSGETLEVSGRNFLVLTMRGGTTVDPDGRSTYSGPTDFTPLKPTLQELILAGDFEAQSTWIIGLAHTTCVRVTPFASPNRLVIDLGK